MVITETPPKVKSMMGQIAELTPFELLALLQLITQRLAELFNPFRPQAVQTQHYLQELAQLGLVTPSASSGFHNPMSETDRQELAQRLGQASTKPLSEIILEERGI